MEDASQAGLFPLWALSRLRMGTDGSGITALVCAHGCPLNCAYCLNPGSRDPDASVRWIAPDELLQMVRKDGLYYSATGGGVCFGGGEPLTHASFISAFKRLIPSDWRISAETSLYVPEDNVRIAAEAIDLFLVDIKDMNPAIYQAYTGRSNDLVLCNLERLLKTVSAVRVVVRVPYIPDLNNEEDVRESVRRLKEMGVEKLDVFRYTVKNRKQSEKPR
ncbi:MAG: radical SAM protein [Clostridia bacterium]|nr:radical SAM protein [Clostridia bacterium]